MARKCLPLSSRSPSELEVRHSIDDARSRRKAVMRTAQAKYPGLGMEWRDGKLIFSQSGEHIPETPIIPKNLPKTAVYLHEVNHGHDHHPRQQYGA